MNKLTTLLLSVHEPPMISINYSYNYSHLIHHTIKIIFSLQFIHQRHECYNGFINSEYMSRSHGSRCKAHNQSARATTCSTEF